MKAKLEVAAAEAQLSQINEEMELFWSNLVNTWQNPLTPENIYASIEWGRVKLNTLYSPP